MKTMIKLNIIFIFIGLLMVQSVFAHDDNQKLFVNLSSDGINRATMAISFSTRVLVEEKIPVTIFLNVDEVRLADNNIPKPTHVNGKSTKTMLSYFMKKGGQVIVCPMCMKSVGGMKKR